MINKDKVISGLEDAKRVIENYVPMFYQLNSPASIDYAIELLKEQPKPKAAHWVKMRGMMPPEFTGHFECDNCGWHGKLNERETDYSFCPGCGSKMSVGTPTIDEIDLSNPLLDEVIEMLEYIAYMRRITDECGANTNKQNEKEK